MKKLTLNLDELRVESFDTERLDGDAGTVRAHDSEGWSDGSICPTVTFRCCPP